MADEFTKAALYGIKTFNKKVKEKIGIAKLIELLNEYMVECGLSPAWVISGNGVRAKKSYYGEEISEMVIISKKYGFIKRLIEKDKIDKDKLYNSEYKPYFWNRKTNAFSGFWAENILLMLLAISDKPIEDLISYLK